MPLLQLLRELRLGMRLNRALIVLLVLAAHTLLLAWLWTVVHQALPNRQTRPNSQVMRPENASTIVYLLEPPAPAVIQRQPDQAHQDARATRANPERDPAAPPPVYGNEVSNAAALSRETSAPLTIGDSSAEGPKQLGSSLNLTLSREALKSLPPSLVASSPFRGRLPVTVESKIADAAAETGPWMEEVIDHDHIRFRRGTTCFTISRPEIAKIDAISDWVRNVPWAADHPYECH
jgi:hypothetical protein